MSASSERVRVNQMLMSHGLGKLDDPGLIPQLGFLLGTVVTGHDEFRDFLNRCEPAGRRDFYEAMRSYLKFPVKPLDVYVAEIGARAEAAQLPTVAPDGTLQQFHAPSVQTARAESELAIAQNAVESSLRWHFEVTCTQCTRFAVFHGMTKYETLKQARVAGWQFQAASQTELCPACSTPEQAQNALGSRVFLQ